MIKVEATSFATEGDTQLVVVSGKVALEYKYLALKVSHVEHDT